MVSPVLLVLGYWPEKNLRANFSGEWVRGGSRMCVLELSRIVICFVIGTSYKFCVGKIFHSLDPRFFVFARSCPSFSAISGDWIFCKHVTLIMIIRCRLFPSEYA